jgi:hypothetical protein
MDEIKITKDLKFDLEDLMRTVDFSHEFTLRDVLRASVDSKIPVDVLQALVRCNYIKDYWEEAESKEFDGEDNMAFLELYWNGSIDNGEQGDEFYSSWAFHGIGVKGDLPDDIMDSCTEEEIQKFRDDGFTQAYAVEFSPMYSLADYPITVKKDMCIEYWNEEEFRNTDIEFTPSMTLIELLYAIFWELSFVGSPERRTKQMEELGSRCAELDEARANGTLDEITTRWEDVKKNLEDKFKVKED